MVWRNLFFVVLTLSLLVGCGRQANADGERTKVVRTYEVPAAQIDSVERALQSVIAVDKTGSVSNSNGHLVVLAPESTQESIKQAIEQLVKPEPASTSDDAPVRLRFWQVLATPAGGDADARLQPLKPALDAAVESMGLHGFALEGFTEFMANPGQHFETDGNGSSFIAGSIAPDANGMLLQAMVNGLAESNWHGHFATTLYLRANEFVVLSNSTGPDGGTRLFVVQAQPVAKGG